jgi:hypothetical protein
MKHSLLSSPSPLSQPLIAKFVIESRVSSAVAKTVKESPSKIFRKVPKILPLLSNAVISVGFG